MTSNKSVASGALTLANIVIADNKNFGELNLVFNERLVKIYSILRRVIGQAAFSLCKLRLSDLASLA